MSDTKLELPRMARRPVSRSGIKFVVSVVLVATAFITLFGWVGFRINMTSSYPMGLYRITHRPPQKGDLVMFRLDPENPMATEGFRRGYLRAGFLDGFAPLVKKLAALPGDAVSVTDHVEINGARWLNGEVQLRDSKGRPVPAVAKSETVPEGFCWVLSDYNPSSFDSRYFGHIPTASLSAIAHPVLVWKTAF